MHSPDTINAPADPDTLGSRPLFARIEFYIPLIVIAGVALAVLLYAEGLFRLGTIADPRGENKLAIAIAAPDTPEVVLYASPTTARYLATVGGSQEILLARWRHFLTQTRRPFREVRDPAQLNSLGTPVVIVPTALALTDAEEAALRAHQQRGGSLLATGAFGARDGRGEWTQWQAMGRLFQVRVTGEVPADSEARFLVTLGETPVTRNLPAGSRIWLGRPAEAPLRLAGGKPAARLLDWARTPDKSGAGVVYGDTGGARWVLFGYSENAWDFSPTDLNIVAADTLDWLQRRPAAHIGAWPDGLRAAQIVEMDTEEGLVNAAQLASMLDLLKMRGTFYLLSSQAALFPDVVRHIAANHEIGFHGDVHTEFKGLSASAQKTRLAAMRQQLAGVLPAGEAATGFRPPHESYDATTEQVLQAMGFRHHAVDPNRSDHRLPLFAKANSAPPEADLVVLPRTQRDDLNLLHGDGPELGQTVALMKGELQGTIEQGALGLLSVHSQNFHEDALINKAVAPWLMTLADKRREVWIATSGEVAAWWRKRERLGVSVASYGKRYELEISNRGTQAVEGATVMVFHPDRGGVRLSATKAWMPEATVLPVDAYRSRIVLGRLRPGNYAYHLTFE